MTFPCLEDEVGQAFGEATWENAVDMFIAFVGHGYHLKRRNKVKVGLKSLRTAATFGFACALTTRARAACPVLQ